MYDDDWAIEHRLAVTRRRRTTAARVMVAVLVVPLVVQGVFVSFGVAARWGMVAVVLPAVVLWILVAGRR